MPRTLRNRLILNTRPKGQNQELTELLVGSGANVVECPMLKIIPRDFKDDIGQVLMAELGNSWLVFTSANGVRMFHEGLLKSGEDCSHIYKISSAAIGGKTARVVKELGFNLEFTAEDTYSESFAVEFSEHLKTKGFLERKCRIFLLRGGLASETLIELLSPKDIDLVKEKDIDLVKITVYESGYPELSEAEIFNLYRGLGVIDSNEKVIDAITLTSSEAAKNLYQLVIKARTDGLDVWNEHVVNFPVAVIGIKTANTVSELGWRNVFIAKEANIEKLVEAVESALS